MDVQILLVLAVSAWPTTARKRIVAALVGCLAIFILNVARICSLYYVGVHLPVVRARSCRGLAGAHLDRRFGRLLGWARKTLPASGQLADLVRVPSQLRVPSLVRSGAGCPSRPDPFMADIYTSLWGTFANGALFVADHGSNVGFRFAPPPAIRARGSWEASLRLEDRRSGDTSGYRDERAKLLVSFGGDVRRASVAAAARRFRYLLAVLGGALATLVLTLVLAAVTAFQQGFGRIYGSKRPTSCGCSMLRLPRR